MPTVSKPDDKPDMSALSALALVGQVGLAMVIPIVAATLAGIYLDRRLGTRGLATIGMILAGTACGAYAAYRLLVKELP